MSERHTLAHPATHSDDIRKSRFVANAHRAESANVALAVIGEIGRQAATHHCWAYRIGAAYRFSDDGELAGTAGRPILQAIDSQGFDHVVVVVTRWYGGIKLGAGGLARAYGGTAAECLRLASRIVLVQRVEVEVCCEFGVLALLQARLAELGVDERCIRFDADGVTVVLRVPVAQRDVLVDLVRDLTRGRGTITDLIDSRESP